MKPNSPQNDAMLEARLLDAIRLCSRRYQPVFVGFLSEAQAFSAQGILRREGFFRYLFWGGFEEAERVMFGAFPEYQEPDPSEFPIAAFTASFRECDVLTHRDFLGALMGAGINRDTVGDLLVEPGRGVLFLREEISEYVSTQLTKIGRVGVRVAPGFEEPLPGGLGFVPFSGVIASPRLDCAAAAALQTSREKAARLVEAGSVLLNGIQTLSLSATVKAGDRLSVRGMGRFILDQIGPETKKGRFNLSGRKYR
ncbi:YlmH family RNA-binding protein [Clostridium minihomine]|uniref:YlmH family RNA-binding protein n=1 Tax=Clostridium minihomine TaxID=2045012 RepID=UPI000C7685DC|nr:YlmH/Sll1252 family protein [Clostridium minihomine]